MRPPAKATEFDGDLSEFLRQYEYQPKLTAKLDDLDTPILTPELVRQPARHPLQFRRGRGEFLSFSPDAIQSRSTHPMGLAPQVDSGYLTPKYRQSFHFLLAIA